ncbi:MAG: glycosyltransferase family 2 protein [Caldilineaceae bacterium]|nr:glycosyltransferase family 2 protein [Caldilineaceae bacterium]
MSDESLTPTPDTSKSEEVKPEDVRHAQVEQAKARLAAAGPQSDGSNPIVNDATYGDLREKNRVVMRHKIALNIDNFRASTDDFNARPQQEYPALKSVRPPFMSVIIPNRNGERFLPTVLDALARQTFQDFETIVIDDASTDDSVAIVENHYPAVRLMVNRRNVGFAASCNLAAAAADGRILVLLNSDTEPESDWLEALARTIVTHPNAAIVASKLLLFEERDVLHSAGDTLGVDGIPRNRGVWQTDHGQFDARREVFSGCGGAGAYRREAWEALGGFDESFWMYLEDVDLSFRARLMGWETVFAPDARVYHHLSANAGDILSSYYVGRNTIWNIAKNMPDAILTQHLPAILRAQAIVTRDALANLQGAAARARLRGQIAGLLGLPHQLEKRRLIQQRKYVGDREIERALETAD